MKKTAGKLLLILAVFLSFPTDAQTAEKNRLFNPLAIPELTGGPTLPSAMSDGYQVLTAPDPRYGVPGSPHREIFVPASEVRPPEPSLSIPVVNHVKPMHYDLNEWEERRFFSSNLYTDTSVYSTWVNGDKNLSSRDQGQFYEKNYRYELFSSGSNGDSMALNFDATYTNDKRPYRNGFTLNQATVDSRTTRSRLVLGHAFPEMSEFTMTQNMLGAYGVQKFDYTSLSGFGGYFATEKDDLKNPRYVAGVRLEHSRDRSIRLGVNIVGTEDSRDNSAATTDLPAMSNKVLSIDMRLRPTENIFIDGEIAHSGTDFDKQNSSGRHNGDAFRFKAGYERENLKYEAGIEQAETDFFSPLGQTPRDETAYFARFFYELNNYLSGRFSQRISRDNIANYQRSTIVREQPEIQISLKPSEYYRNMRFDFFYSPLEEYSRNSAFMKRFRDIIGIEFNHQAGQFIYLAELTHTIDKDDINVLNDRDIQRFDFNLTWEFDKLNRVYSSISSEKLSYKRAGGMDQTTWFGFGGSSRFHENVLLNIDYQRENIDPVAASSNHDRLNLSLTREYGPSSRLIIGLEGNRSKFSQNRGDFDDYTAKMRYLKAF